MVTKKTATASESQEPPAGNLEALPDQVPSPESPTSIPEEKPSSSNSGKEKTEKADIPILPDVEQFWHERDTVPSVQDTDPIPWEHED
jgi:G protein-coupled receptor 151